MIPNLTSEQRRESLEKAMEARKRRSELLSGVRDGSITVPEFISIAETDEAASRTKVSALIKSVPGYGNARTARLMADIGIAETRRIRGLGYRQTAALVATLSDKQKEGEPDES